jgi:glycosyltransferase involved in cell wall biosynthesis
MDSEPTVSVVVVVRNGEQYLERALRSILAQGYKPLEIIVVDGNSTDRTVEIATRFPLVRVVTQPGAGISDAYNCGIAAASGEYVAFLSHDDEWTPDKLSTQMSFMREQPDLEYTLAMARSQLEEGHQPPPGFRRELLDHDHAGTMETMLARKTVFERVGGFDPGLGPAEDLDWFSRARDAGVLTAVVPSVLVIKHIHSSNLSLTDQNNDRGILRLLRSSIKRKQSS